MITWSVVLLRLFLASVFGAIIGLERERKNWSAGMRTHMLVCLGAALTILVSAYGFNNILQEGHIVLDPSRVAAQVISGIGFLGAGVIIFTKPGFIRGLTTASGLWVVAGIGLATGAGMYTAAGITTGIAFIILLILQPLENKFAKRFKRHYVRIGIDITANPYEVIDLIVAVAQNEINTFSLEKSEDQYIVEIEFQNYNIKGITPTLIEIQKREEVTEVYWTK